MAAGGEMTSLAAETDETQPSSQEIIQVLFSGLSQQASSGEIVAAGICTDVRVTPPDSTVTTDAICVELEHVSGEAVDVFIPYTIQNETVVDGEIVATPGEQRLFIASAG